MCGWMRAEEEPMTRSRPWHALTLVGVLIATLQIAPAPAGARPAAAVGLESAHWIWFPEGDPTRTVPAATRHLRRTFTAPAGPYSDAQLVLTGDDTADVWLNDT